MHALTLLSTTSLRILRQALLWTIALGASGLHAASHDTLGLIATTGTIRLGHRESSVPFSYYDRKHQVVGYSQDLMTRAVDLIRKEMKLPALTVKLVPVTSQNRTALVQNGTVDLECGSTSHTRERERQVAFSVSIFVAQTRLMVHKDSGVRDFNDLAGKRVAVTAGSTSDRVLRLHAHRRRLKLDIVQAREHSAGFELLQSGQVDAFMLDDALLYGERAKAQHPEDWIVVGTPLSKEHYACMMRQDDPAFKDAVDRALTQLMQSGEALRIHQRWFQRPIPPFGLNLNWPATPELLQLYREPNSRPPD